MAYDYEFALISKDASKALLQITGQADNPYRLIVSSACVMKEIQKKHFENTTDVVSYEALPAKLKNNLSIKRVISLSEYECL